MEKHEQSGPSILITAIFPLLKEFRDLLKNELSESFPDLELPDFPPSPSRHNDKLSSSAIDKMIESSNRLAPSDTGYGMDIGNSANISASDALNGMANDYDSEDNNVGNDDVMIV